MSRACAGRVGDDGAKFGFIGVGFAKGCPCVPCAEGFEKTVLALLGMGREGKQGAAGGEEGGAEGYHTR